MANHSVARSLRCAVTGHIIGSLFEGSAVRGDYPDSVVTGFPRNSPLVAMAFQTGKPLTVATVDIPVAGSRVTDDSVLSFAVADYLCGNGTLVESLKGWFQAYQDAGYGSGFTVWAQSPQATNGSWGNGAAMRVSPIIDLARSVTDVLSLAAESARPTHDHTEAIDGAQAIALCGYLVKQNVSNEELCAELARHFPEIAKNSVRPLNEIRTSHEFSVRAIDTVPIAIAVFLDSEDLEDLYRKALSMGGDVDTIATMAGSIGAYRYDLPDSLVKILASHLDEHMLKALDRFECYLGDSCRPVNNAG